MHVISEVTRVGALSRRAGGKKTELFGGRSGIHWSRGVLFDPVPPCRLPLPGVLRVAIQAPGGFFVDGTRILPMHKAWPPNNSVFLPPRVPDGGIRRQTRYGRCIGANIFLPL